jgi:hypothetical protein
LDVDRTSSVRGFTRRLSVYPRSRYLSRERIQNTDGGIGEIETLSAPTRASGVQRLHLGGLNVAEAGALVDAADTALDPATLHERTDGLPLFVVSLINSSQSGSLDEFPASVAESVAHRERLLPPTALALLQLCSLVGMVAPRLVLRTVADDLDDIAFADALLLVRNRLVTETPSSAEIRLRHPLVQEAVYAGHQRPASLTDPHPRGAGRLLPAPVPGSARCSPRGSWQEVCRSYSPDGTLVLLWLRCCCGERPHAPPSAAYCGCV